MSATNQSDAVTKWSKIAALVATLATIVSGFNAIQVSRFETDLKQLEAERELNFRIYSSIADALESGDHKRVLAVRGIVEAMASESIKPAFRQALEPAMQRVFEQEQLEVALISEKHSSSESNGESSQPPNIVTTPTPTEDEGGHQDGNWEQWDFDIFWCASSGVEAESLATKIVYALKKNGAEGRIRTRVLPDSINRKKSYRASGLEIRRSANEIAMGNKLAAFIQTLPGFEDFQIKEKLTKQKTPWYISAFVCPDLGG